MKSIKLHKLSQEVINQIAAGEVVERPSSVVKELVDNAVDAQASKITVRVKNGGIDLIEVSDNGIGVPKDNLPNIFEAHTTSKIQDINDLNNLLSMGFRGEALSTITSVSKVEFTSKYKDEKFGYKIESTQEGVTDLKKTPKETGTNVKVENLFYNIPARRKYLKTAQTEYRKIYQLFSNYILIYPNIHFILEKDGKEVVNVAQIPESSAGEISEERVKRVLGKKEFVKIFYEGYGKKITGYVNHPNEHKSSRPKSFVFINNRAIADKGITRAVYEGFSRFLPFGQKIDFVVNISMPTELVDVNVHPRKEEVRFENPYRVYSAVEEAVKHALEKEMSYESTHSSSDTKSRDFSSLRDNFNKTGYKKKDSRPPQTYTQGKKQASVRDTLLFSKELLSETSDVPLKNQNDPVGDVRNVFQIFNKYLVLEFFDEKLWILDQHAAAERINFEKLNRKNNKLDLQNYLVPSEIDVNEEEKIFLEEQKEFFEELGIIYEIKGGKVSLLTVPSAFSEADFDKVFQEIFEIEDSLENLKKNFTKLKEDVIATISCHSSIRSGQKLQRDEMLNLFKELFDCKNPYSCPHGRPIVWKMTLSDIDNNFERTY